MPPLDVVLTAWQIYWAAAVLIGGSVVLYALGLKAAAARGHRQPVWRTLAFYVCVH